jgi:hypothetical protein
MVLTLKYTHIIRDKLFRQEASELRLEQNKAPMKKPIAPGHMFILLRTK